MKISAPRGTQDIFGERARLWQIIEAIAIEIFNQAGFSEIRSPIFEATELFKRAVGEESDIVNKEMYTFLDRSERSITLRPEGTASIVRVFIENNLDRENKPQKFWYRGPMFRYERPQTGRYRQFHQIGVEALGAKAPYIDLELINLALLFLKKLGLENLTLHINSIGNSESRKNYTNSLKTFLEKLKDQVCDDCKRRIESNPLRCLDCKVPEDQKLYFNAPKIHDFFDEESKAIWNSFLDSLQQLEIKYTIDPALVRGLDYYSHIVFEIKTSDPNLGTQSTVLAGGRFDKLISNLGGPDLPAAGWACGLERISLLAENSAKNLLTKTKKVFIISDDAKAALELSLRLREDLTNTIVELDYEESKFKKQLEKALKKNSDFIIFLLEEERKQGKFKIKNTASTEEKEINNYQELIINLKQ